MPRQAPDDSADTVAARRGAVLVPVLVLIRANDKLCFPLQSDARLWATSVASGNCRPTSRLRVHRQFRDI